nr:hypothetical protein [Tanacetum cinerariifolium]
ETILKIKLAFEDKNCQPEDILELFRRLHNDVQNIHEELAVYINTLSWDYPTIYYNDDDDEDCTIAITPKEPDKSLNMGDEHLDTIPAMKSDEFINSSFENLVPNPKPDNSLSMGDEYLSIISETKPDEVIKFSVNNLVPIPSEFKVTSDNESECDVPVCDDFTTFSNPLFDCNDDFTSSDDGSRSNEDVLIKNFKIYSNSLFDDEEIISTK